MVRLQQGRKSTQEYGVQTICVTGATGFIGSHALPLLQRPGVRVRVLSRSNRPKLAGVDNVIGDLFDKTSLVPFLRGADVLINLAQPGVALSDDQFASGIRNLAHAARDAGVARVLHISTAMVIGVPTEKCVTEGSPVQPRTVYERQKYLAEQTLRTELGDSVDFGILRPTAVFGLGGQNLLKLACGIANGSVVKRCLLRFLHGNRNMHLVSVHVVASSIAFLAYLARPLAGEVFLVSSDDEHANNYQAVDTILAVAMGKPPLNISARLPSTALKFLLRLVGRSQADPALVYDASKLRSWGFTSSLDFKLALQDFAVGLLKNGGR